MQDIKPKEGGSAVFIYFYYFNENATFGKLCENHRTIDAKYKGGFC